MDDEYEDEIVERKLKLEDLGKKEKVAGREVYTHIAWADKMATSVKGAKWVVFEGPAHATGKKPEPSRTEPQKTEPLYAVFSGLQPVATTVFTILTKKKTVENRFEPV